MIATGLIHDLGKVLCKYGEPQWAVVGDTFPVGTTKWEKRNIALEIPVWDEKLCIQCGKCVMVCPHAAIREDISHNLLALEVAGMPGAALYPGSWSEWCAEPSRPVAVGA